VKKSSNRVDVEHFSVHPSIMSTPDCFSMVSAQLWLYWANTGAQKKENHAVNACSDCRYRSGRDHRRGAASPCRKLALQRVARGQVPELPEPFAVRVGIVIAGYSDL
jgi:hypothetical protein